ncbi:uncharacterized protein LOC110458828 isoform X3 [Mizuhopecten yessoensis]|uniref:uncharacterized protein LOC110458828 isoform X3 n=1 Tax=Mizuhopecten yessoensis TaxID=6573 RepID=UPI000B45BF01|nr:uncharacterized protein LOC110458828 isoform X3 [Mizuhopecten yessoensis]
MENKFGVTLKSTGAGKPTDRNFKPAASNASAGKKSSVSGPPKKFTDLKARFDDNDEKKDQVSNKTVRSPVTKRREFGTDYSAKKSNSSSFDKGKLSQTTKLERHGESGLKTNVASRGSSERKTKIEEKLRQDTQDDNDGAQIAVGKVFTRQDSNTYTATVENRVQRQGSSDDPVDKVQASNLLTGQLAMLRIRPGSGGKKDERTTFSSRTVEKSNNGFSKVESTTTTASRNFNTKSKPFSTNSESSGSPKIGKKFASSSSAPMEFGLSFSPKKSDDSKSLLSKKISSHSRQSSSDSIGSSTSSPRSNTSTDLVQLDSSSIKKLDALLGTGKVEHRGNRVETKTVTKTMETGVKRPGSPRTIVTETKIVTTSVSKKPGINKTIRSREEVTTFSTSQSESHTGQTRGGKKTDVIKTSSGDTKPDWLDKSQQLVSKFQTKMKPTARDVLVNVSDNSNVMKSRTAFIKPADRTVKQLTVSKAAGVNKPGKTDINSNKMAPAWETRVAASSLQRRSSDLSDTGSDISSRSSSSLPSTSSSDILKIKQRTIRKLEPGNFKKIMGNFEEISKSGSTTPERKMSDPKIEFKKPLSRAKSIVLERKNSFECPPSPPISPRDATQLVLKETGPIPNVKKFAKEINSGRVRAFSTGSIRDSGSEQEYNDALSRRHAKDWPSSDLSSDENEALYELVGDPGVEDGDGKARHSRNMNRRLGQKRKGVHRPSFEEQSSSDMTTEGSSKDGTLESTDDRAAEGDAENDSDSSNSGIYEPIDQDWVNKLKIERSEQPPELPADRKKKKKKKDGNKSGAAALGSKLKKFYNKPKKSGGEPGLSKVSSAPQLCLSEQSTSSGVLNKIGDKLKLITRAKSSDPKLLTEAEVVISSSEYDAEGYTEEDREANTMSIPLEDIVYIDSSSSIDQAESPDTDNRYNYEDTAPPLPPRVASDEEESAPKPPPKTRSSMIKTLDTNLGLVPMRPPKRNSSRPQSEDEASTPALPPRNRVSTNVNLDTVVPVTPGMVTTAHSTGDLRKPKGQWHASTDSYLHGHMLQSSRDTDHSDGPPAPHRSNSGEENIYIECDRPGAQEQEANKRPLEKKLSSLYMKSADVASAPDKSPTNQKSNGPFQDILMFQSQYQNTADDNMYLDLNRIKCIQPVLQRFATIDPEDEDQLYGTLGERYTPKIYATEPLYQYYHKDMASRASKKCSVMHAQSDDEEDDERIYEALDDVIESPGETKADRVKTSTLEMFTKKTGSAMRALWCEMAEVKKSGLLETLSSQERKIQEATFEIVTSEATYLRSLNVLIDTFLRSQEFSAEHSDRCVLTRQERHVIFSNIGAIRDASEGFLSALEAKWQESVLMENISSIIESHANTKFECYVRYCSNQTFQERQVQELMKKPEFSDAIRRMESYPDCQGLPMMSFLLLPMQRITRLPLLVDAICHRMEPATEQHKGATRALEALNRVVRKCNDGAKKMQQTEQMCRLVQNLEFKVKEIPLISASRYLLKQGELTRVLTDTSSRLPLRKGKTKQAINIFLFNDIILISKKKRNRFSYSFTPQNINELLNTQYVVYDHAPRNSLHVEMLESTDKSRYLPQGAPSGCKNLFVVVLLENHEQKHTELILSCKSTSDRTRWIDSLSPSAKENDSEKIYEEWDCPQVQCTKKYSATEPDELSLEESDVINVFKKMGDGWYEGERIRDGERGWFPSDYTMEIVNSHVRARNLRLRYRLLLASQDYGDVYS